MKGNRDNNQVMGVNLKPYRLHYYNNSVTNHGPRDCPKNLQDYISDQQFDLERQMECLTMRQRDTGDSNYYRERQYFGRKRSLRTWYEHRLTDEQRRQILNGQDFKVDKSVLPPMPMSNFLMSADHQRMIMKNNNRNCKKKGMRKSITMGDINTYIWPNYATSNKCKNQLTTVKDLLRKDENKQLTSTLHGNSIKMHVKESPPYEKIRTSRISSSNSKRNESND